MTDLHDEAAWAAHLETLRRSVDLFLDREGHWFHNGEPFEHTRLINYFNAGIDAHPETGEPIVHLGPRWCYFRAEDTPFLVRRFEDAADGLYAILNNSERLPVPAGGFEAVGEHVYVQLAPHRRARLDRSAQATLWGWLDAEAEPPVVVTAAGRWPVVGG
jgi:hypothetical protein